MDVGPFHTFSMTGIGIQHVHHLHAAWDWTSWLDELPMQMHGHCATAKQKKDNQEAVHVFRFMLRSDVDEMCWSEAKADSTEIITAWPALPPDADDVIMLNKAYVASPEISQVPVVFCPAIFLQTLDPSNIKMADSVDLSGRQKKELAKSAEYFAREPLGLSRSATFLQSLVNCDGSPRAHHHKCRSSSRDRFCTRKLLTWIHTMIIQHPD